MTVIEQENAINTAAFEAAIAAVREAWNRGVANGSWGCTTCPNKNYCAIEGCQK